MSGTEKRDSGIGFFEKNLSVWVILCMAAGILIGRFLPGAKLNRASVESSLLCDGSIIDGGMVRDSLIGLRTRVQPGANIEVV